MMSLRYIVQAVQTIGDVSSTTMGGFGRDAKDTELGGAIKGQGSGAAERSHSASMPTGPLDQRLDHSSRASRHTAPTSLTSDASEGKLWTTLDLRFISLFRRS